MEGATQVPGAVPNDSVTTQTEIGELTVRVYREATVSDLARDDGTTSWRYDVVWRGLLLWSDIVPRDRSRHHVEFRAASAARRLGHALANVHEAGGSPPATWMTYGWTPRPPMWVPVPDLPEGTGQ